MNPNTSADLVPRCWLSDIRGAALSANTRRAIASGWAQFEAWCRFRGVEALPCTPDTLVAFLVHRVHEGRKVATIEALAYAVNARHLAAGHVAPGASETVRETLSGIRRSRGEPQRQAAALTIEHVRQMRFDPASPRQLRDRALLFCAVTTGLRRSELSALRLEHVHPADYGLSIVVPRSKGDQTGQGQTVEIVRAGPGQVCPVEAVTAWMEQLPWVEGPLFCGLRHGQHQPSPLTGDTINRLVKARAAGIGLDPALYSGHSTRAGCATYLLEQGIPLNVVSKHLRHKSANTTLRYDRSATARALEGVY